MGDYLYKSFDAIRRFGNLNAQIPKYLIESLNPNLELRKYQKEAFENFICYYENPSVRTKPTHLLFHMATGSGKTLMMAGLILYLYKQGYRNFLFFVNSKNIIEKTKDNFLNQTSSKYLFNNSINIDGNKIRIKEVNNFQMTNENDINICFTTIHALHGDINFVKENKLSLDDFKSKKIVMISDEAHHINSITSSGKLDKAEKEALTSWEYTVDRILASNDDNILLDFTATCDTDNEFIKNKYLDKIIYNYPLSKFREDKYSKEVDTFQSNVDLQTKMLQAVLFSQYRLKVFQKNRINIKPVILFKSDTIDNSKENMKLFLKLIENLTDDQIMTIKENATSEVLINMFIFFEENNILISNLVREIKDDFSKSKCISVNDDNEAYNSQLIVNSLESKDNLYRAIFEVRKLDEGWDVLNLFDIVRLYETRDSYKNKPGKKTVQEAQLIGRGARYCPFVIEDIQEQYKRKYDNDIQNPLRICETLLYHCQNDSKYISELKVALKETGILPESSKKVEYKLKESFKKEDFYQNGVVFFNKKVIKDRTKVNEISDKVRNETYETVFYSGRTKTQNLFEEKKDFKNIEEKLNRKLYLIKDIAEINYNIILRNLRRINIYKFNILKNYFPNLKSIKEFILDDKYLGNIKIAIESIYKEPTIDMINTAVYNMLIKIKDKILLFDETYEGTKEFYSVKFNEIFKDKVCNISNPEADGVGISQSLVEDSSYRLDLSDKDWYVYNDNYGTTEEKKFVKYFVDYVDDLKKTYDKVFLVRNERTLAIYSFDLGQRTEPDFLLILIDNKTKAPQQYQIFIEAKGNQLLIEDEWKEKFLKELSAEAIPVKKFVDDNKYLIWGFPFFNKNNKIEEFNKAMQEIIK